MTCPRCGASLSFSEAAFLISGLCIDCDRGIRPSNDPSAHDSAPQSEPDRPSARWLILGGVILLAAYSAVLVWVAGGAA